MMASLSGKEWVRSMAEGIRDKIRHKLVKCCGVVEHIIRAPLRVAKDRAEAVKERAVERIKRIWVVKLATRAVIYIIRAVGFRKFADSRS